MDPPYSVDYNADTLTVPTDAQREKVMRDVFLSPALFQVVGCVIGSAGKTNMAIAMAQVGLKVKVAKKLIPFAAFLVSRLSLVCISYSCASHLLLARHRVQNRGGVVGAPCFAGAKLLCPFPY